MLIYEVEAVVDEKLCGEYERYMNDRHIRDVLATGRLEDASFETAGPRRYRVRYKARDRASLESYLKDYSETLRADFATRFPRGIEVTRNVWTVIKQFA